MTGVLARLARTSWYRFVGVALLGLLLSKLGSSTVVSSLTHADPILLSAAIVLMLPMMMLKTLRWLVLLRCQAIRSRFGPAYLAYWSSTFLGLLTPGRVGAFTKAVYVSKDCNVSAGRAFASVLADSLFDVSALLPVGIVALASLSEDHLRLRGLAGALLVVVLAVWRFVAYCSFDWIRDRGIGKKLSSLAPPLADAWNRLRELRARAVIIALLLTAVAYLLFFVQCYLLALSMALPAGFAATSGAVALGNLVALIPISISGLGTREAAIIGFLSSTRVPAEAALSFSLLVFFTFCIVAGGIGAVAWWIKPLSLTAREYTQGAALGTGSFRQ